MYICIYIYIYIYVYMYIYMYIIIYRNAPTTLPFHQEGVQTPPWQKARNRSGWSFEGETFHRINPHFGVVMGCQSTDISSHSPRWQAVVVFAN